MPAAAGDSCGVVLQQVGHWDEDIDSEYADVWGAGNVAYVAQFGDNKVHFIDISDPANPVRITEWVVGAPNQGASAQDVKVGDGLLFISLESNSGDRVEIVDVRDPFNPQHLTFINTPGIGPIHNTFYDSGFLYLVDSSSPVVAIIDLTSYDPDNAPAAITDDLWLFNVGSAFVHDITVENGRLYVCAWSSGLWVYDVTNVATELPTFLGSGTGTSTHAVWPSSNGRWAVVGEERPNGPIKLYEIVPNGQNVDVILRDTVTLPDTKSFSAHNPVVVGTRVYVSWYQAGLRVLDIDEATATLVEVAEFDTFLGGAGGFNGAWGVYPFLGEDRILISDLATGLYVVEAATPFLSISYPDGLVSGVDPVSGATLTVQIAPNCDMPVASTAKLFVQDSITGGGFTQIPLVSIGGDLFEANLPPAPCDSVVTYYISVDVLGGQTVLDPPGAPGETFSALVFSNEVVVFEDAFQADQGWTVGAAGDDATTGIWERVDPIGTGAQPEDDHTTDPGTICFVTGQGSIGGGIGENDIDGGQTTLISPTIDLSGGDAIVSYWRWYSNASGSSPNADILVVDISNDGGSSWTNVETVGPGGIETFGGWFHHEFWVSDFVVPTAQMQLRFVASDQGDGSIVEVAVDDFRVFVRQCVTNPQCLDGVLNQDEDRIDCGGVCPPCECLSNTVCDDGAYCNGQESCDAFGACVAGTAPCAPQPCDDLDDICLDCANDADCNDNDVCTAESCVGTICEIVSIKYGDTTRDGTINIFDLLCVLAGFAGNFSQCTLSDVDIAGCAADGIINIFDLLTVLNSFAGNDPCCSG